jgi:uncharacterized protein
VTSNGGQVLNAPTDVLDAGRMAIFEDPIGATFGAWEPALNTPEAHWSSRCAT